MTANYHTPHATGAPLTSAEVNSPLSELDAHLTNVLGLTFNAAEYGVVAGGVAATNRAALQALFDACHAAGGGRVLLPGGTIAFDATVEVPYPVVLSGQGSEVTILSYTGSATTALRFKNYSTGLQRIGCRFENFKLINTGAVTNAVGMDMKGLTRSIISQVHVEGFNGATGVGIKIDGSYGGSIGAWWNLLINNRVTLCGTGLQMTGVSAAGQANANTVYGGFYGNTTVYGIAVLVGDTNVIEAVDVSSTNGGVGIYVNDNLARIINTRSENVPIGIELGPLAVATTISGPSISGSTTAGIQIDAGASHIDIIHPYVLGSPTNGISIAAGANKVKIIHPKFGTPTTEITDLGTATASSRSMRGGELVPLFFVRTDIAASLTSSAMAIAGADPGLTQGQFLARPYEIRGISYRLSAAITAGTMTLKPTIGGTESTTLAAVATSGTTGSAWQGIGKDTNAGSSSPGVKITTDSGFLPAGSLDIIIIVWIEFTDL